MKNLTRILYKILAFHLSIIAGSWLGAQVRPIIGAPPSQGGMFHMEDEQGHKMQSVPIITHMLPGLALAALAKPRWLMAFLGSFTASLLLGDEYEKRMLVALKEKIESAVEKSGSEPPVNA